MNRKILQNIVIDLGNTRTKIAWFEGREMIRHTEGTADELKEILASETGYDRCIISSVVKEIPGFIPSNALILDETTPLPVKNKYLTPNTLGKDRLANACFTSLLEKGTNYLIIDAGTCLKFDFVNHQGEYLGGSISPGLTMRYQAMHTFTYRLPLLKPMPTERYLGRNTEESMSSGAYYGMRSEIEAMTDLYRKDYGDLQIFLTGGDAPVFANGFNFTIFADPFLTLRGLNAILEHNA